ncbi:hypothetical protein ACFL6G_07720 [candidate division KSB1 bacterium]
MKKAASAIFTLCIMTNAMCSTVSAQEIIDDFNYEQSQWIISFQLGSTTSGPAKDIEQAMISSEFDDRFTLRGKTKSYPYSETGIGEYGSFTWTLSANRCVTSHFNTGLLISKSVIGKTFGYHCDYIYLDIEYSLLTIAPTVEFNILRYITFGIGPALYLTESVQLDAEDDSILSKNKSSIIGYLIDFGLTLPARTKAYFEFKAQFRGVGSVQIGPYNVTASDEIHNFSKTNVNFDHSYFGFGLGLRF